MKKPISVQPHLSLEEVEARDRQAKDAVERSHWQFICLLAQGKTTKEIQEFTGYCLAWIRSIAHRYNQGGPPALGDRRQTNPGGSFLLSPEHQAQLEQALEGPAPGWRVVDRTPGRPLDPGPPGTPGASAAGLGVSQAAGREPAHPASPSRQGRSDDPRGGAAQRHG